MRSVSFLDFTEFALEGNVMSKALVLGDVDSDGNNELVVGTTNGILSVYKGLQSSQAWLCACNLGMIACIGVGDLCNQGYDSLYCLSTDGWCYIFQLFPESYKDESKHENPENSPQIITPTFSQKLSPNSKACVITDIDGDGRNEMVVAYSDRMVRTFKWSFQTSSSVNSSSLPAFTDHSFVLHEKWKLAGQIGSMTVRTLVSGGVEVLVSQPGGSYVALICSCNTTAPSTEKNNKRNKKYNYNNSNYIYTNDDSEDSISVDGGKKDTANDDCNSGTSICYHPLGSFRARNGNVSTEIISNIAKNNSLIKCNDNCSNNANTEFTNKTDDSANSFTPRKNSSDSNNKDSTPHTAPRTDSVYHSAICTLDGTLTLIDEDLILWSLYIDHQLFSLNKMDITGDGSEEVVACSWDGHTYIVNLCKQVVRFHFRDHVAAFCSGKMTMDNGRLTNCMCYATFTGRLVVYYDMDLTSVTIKSASEMAEEDESILSMLKKMGIDGGNIKAKNRFLKKVLYKPQKFLKQSSAETKVKTWAEKKLNDDEDTKPIEFKIKNNNNEQK